MMERKCNATSPGSPGVPEMTCDREDGHDGPHRGYNDLIDAPMFWPQTAYDHYMRDPTFVEDPRR